MRLSFSWKTFRLHWVDGYRLIDDATGEVVRAQAPMPSPPYLVKQADLFDSRPVKDYRPEDDLALHQTFASLDAEPEKILSWAQEYGLLTEGAIFENPTQPQNPEGGIEVRNCYQGETLEFWADETRAMRFVLLLWKSSRKNTPENFERLSHYIGRSPGADHLYLRNQPQFWRLRPVDQIIVRHPSTDQCFVRGNLSVAARHYVCTLLNNYLRNRVSAIVGTYNGLLAPAFIPRNLIGALVASL